MSFPDGSTVLYFTLSAAKYCLNSSSVFMIGIRIKALNLPLRLGEENVEYVYSSLFTSSLRAFNSSSLPSSKSRINRELPAIIDSLFLLENLPQKHTTGRLRFAFLYSSPSSVDISISLSLSLPPVLI